MVACVIIMGRITVITLRSMPQCGHHRTSSFTTRTHELLPVPTGNRRAATARPWVAAALRGGQGRILLSMQKIDVRPLRTPETVTRQAGAPTGSHPMKPSTPSELELTAPKPNLPTPPGRIAAPDYENQGPRFLPTTRRFG